MRWILIIVGCLVFAIVLVVAIGWLLPQAHVATRRARFAQPPERVFAIITDFAQIPSWRSDVSRVELLPPQNGQTVFREHAGHDAITYRVEQIEPPRRLVVRIADPSLPFGGAWFYELQPAADGAELTITERGEVYNPVFRFMSRFVFSHHATIDRYLRALGAKLGETTTPEPVGTP
jgi:uncharacterized protein YndB with AHSA1/START domain